MKTISRVHPELKPTTRTAWTLTGCISMAVWKVVFLLQSPKVYNQPAPVPKQGLSSAFDLWGFKISRFPSWTHVPNTSSNIFLFFFSFFQVVLVVVVVVAIPWVKILLSIFHTLLEEFLNKDLNKPIHELLLFFFVIVCCSFFLSQNFTIMQKVFTLGVCCV
jgi:hypothetical protein